MEMQNIRKTYKSRNLQGVDFSGQTLVGADFSGSDIRGAKFNNCDLSIATFESVRAGISNSWKVKLRFMTTFLSLLAGLISGYSGALISNLFFGESAGPVFGIVSLTLTFIFLTNVVLKGINITLAILLELSAAALIASMALFPNDQAMLAVDAQFTALSTAGYTAGLINIATAIAIVESAELFRSKSVLVAVSGLGLLLGVLFGVSQVPGYPIAIIVGLLTIAIGSYVGQKALLNATSNKYQILQQLAKTVVAKGATTFHSSNLTSLNFSNSDLKNTDLRDSVLTRVDWNRVQGLHSARLENTYLENADIRELVITKDGQGRKYDNCSLRGLNLELANFEGASLIASNLSGSNLKGANLKGAILVKSQLYQANLDFVELTGAVIENWGISTDTSFKAVKCDYIYTRLPTETDRDPCRKPDDKNAFFEPGDFVDFITPFIKTLDLYTSQGIDIVKVGREFKTLDLVHHQAVDPSALAKAFHIIAQKHPEAELAILTLEGEKDERVRVQAKVSNAANRSDIYRDYFETYNQLVSSSSPGNEPLLARLEERGQTIIELKKLLNNALKQPKFYVETYAQGDYVMSQSKGNVSISGVKGNISGVAAGETQNMTGVEMGVVSGSVTNTIHQSSSSVEPESRGIYDLLTQLQAVIEDEVQLSKEDKAEALEQVTLLTEVVQNPATPSTQKAAKTALKILKGTVAGLSEETALVQACTLLLPGIAEAMSALSAPHSEATEQTLPVKSILILAANPKGTASLRISEEARALQTGLERSRYRDYFTIYQRWAVTTTDVRRALLDCKPSIVHFSGHGVGSEILGSKSSPSRKAHAIPETTVEVEGLLFENESGQSQLVSADALADLFSLFSSHVECVVLNACFSEVQADAISQHIPYVVGMKRAIGDQAAIKFSLGFYDALLAGESVDFAYRLGCIAIQLQGLPEHLTPVLKQHS